MLFNFLFLWIWSTDPARLPQLAEKCWLLSPTFLAALNYVASTKGTKLELSKQTNKLFSKFIFLIFTSNIAILSVIKLFRNRLLPVRRGLKMARALRYFANPYPDLDGQELLQVSPEVWKMHALDIANDIQKNCQTVLSSVDGGLYVGTGNNKHILYLVAHRSLYLCY